MPVQFIRIRVYVIPHDKFAEREGPQKDLLFHIPPGHGHDGLPDEIEDQLYVHTALISWQRIQAR